MAKVEGSNPFIRFRERLAVRKIVGHHSADEHATQAPSCLPVGSALNARPAVAMTEDDETATR
jgi:hypothetical protein